MKTIASALRGRKIIVRATYEIDFTELQNLNLQPSNDSSPKEWVIKTSTPKHQCPLGWSARTLVEACRKGELHATRTARGWKFTQESLVLFEQSRTDRRRTKKPETPKQQRANGVENKPTEHEKALSDAGLMTRKKVSR
jgi:hypothetical protein